MSLLGDQRTRLAAVMLTAVALIATVTAIFTGYLTLSVGDQYGHPGSAGWNLLNQGKSGNDASITVHHVIASDYGVHVVYSITMDAPNGRLSSDIVTKPIIDGTKVTDSTTDYMVATDDDKSAVRIASLGEPIPGGRTYGMNVAGFDANNKQNDLSIDVVEDQTPGTVEGGISFMTHPDPEAVHLLHGGYWVLGPQGTTFGVLPSGVIETMETPSYFMISPDQAIREITFEELVAFNEEQRQ